MKKGIQLFACLLILLLYCFALEAISDVSIAPIHSETSSQDNKSQLASDLHGLSTFLEPNGSNVHQTTPTQVAPILKSFTHNLAGLITITPTILDCTLAQYATFLRHFPIPFRALNMLYPSHYFW